MPRERKQRLTPGARLPGSRSGAAPHNRYDAGAPACVTVTLIDVPDGFPEAHADALFDAFGGDAGPAISDGRALLDCAVEGDSLVAAVSDVLRVAERLGLHVDRVEVPASEFRAAA